MSFGSPMRPRDSLRARLTVWYVSALTLTLSAFAMLLYVSLSRTLYEHHDHELLANGAWSGTGVLGPEAFDADPYLDLLDRYGIHHAMVEMEPGAHRPT